VICTLCGGGLGDLIVWCAWCCVVFTGGLVLDMYLIISLVSRFLAYWCACWCGRLWFVVGWLPWFAGCELLS